MPSCPPSRMQRFTAKDRPVACVMGDMNLVRPLGLAGIHCTVVTQSDGLTRFSRFASEAILWPDEEIADGADALLDRLVQFGSSQAQRPVLFYEQDTQLLFVSRNRDALSEAFRFVIADPPLVEDLVDKGRFQALAERLKLPVPKARRVHALANSTPPELDLRFPVVVKPLWRRKSWPDAAKVAKIDTKEALCEAWPRWIAQDIDLLVQEMILGDETRIESYHVYVDVQGVIVAEFTGRKIRTFPITHGHSTALMITAADDVAALGRSLVTKLGLRGVAKFDFKRDPEDRLHLLEVNPRFNLWHHLGAVAGVNLPALVYADMAGLPRPAAVARQVGARWCHFKEDWKAAKEGGMSFPSWLPWAVGCEATLLTWDDPMPFAYGVWRTVSTGIAARLSSAFLQRNRAM
jgi:D-aspartate ligase